MVARARVPEFQIAATSRSRCTLACGLLEAFVLSSHSWARRCCPDRVRVLIYDGTGHLSSTDSLRARSDDSTTMLNAPEECLRLLCA